MPQPDSLYGPSSSILITGASSGIGAALAVHLARYGGRIALFARREDRLQQVAERVSAAGGRPVVVVGDVTDAQAVAAAHARIVAEQGAVTVAFLNAGTGAGMRVDNFTAARVKQVFDVNLMGVVNWLEPVLPPMLERRAGCVVGVSSLAANLGLPGSGVYSASKAAVSRLLETLRLEAKPAGVQITIVEPGFIKSELTARNKFKMPLLMEVDRAVQVIAEAVADGRGWVRFPWQMTAAVRLARHLPRSVYERVGVSMARKRFEKLPSP